MNLVPLKVRWHRNLENLFLVLPLQPTLYFRKARRSRGLGSSPGRSVKRKVMPHPRKRQRGVVLRRTRGGWKVRLSEIHSVCLLVLSGVCGYLHFFFWFTSNPAFYFQVSFSILIYFILLYIYCYRLVFQNMWGQNLTVS